MVNLEDFDVLAESAAGFSDEVTDAGIELSLCPQLDAKRNHFIQCTGQMDASRRWLMNFRKINDRGGIGWSGAVAVNA
jgi:hypothetical protein